MAGVSTATKRAELGDNWPDCECHDSPMLWQKSGRYRGGGGFYCQVSAQERARANRQRRIAEGLCIRCPNPLDTEVLCRPCADKSNIRMGKARPAMLHQLASLRYAHRQREKEER